MKKRNVWNEIRLDEADEPDDIAIGPLHLERLGRRTWWLSVTTGGKRTTITLSSRGQITAQVIENHHKSAIIPRT